MAGFTFAEVLAALIFMAIVIPVALQGVSVANRAGVGAERKEIAVRLAANMINQLSVSNLWQTAQASGTFEEDYPGYTWSMQQQAWPDGAMQQLTLEVVYPLQGREFAVELSTLVDDSAQ
jgi:type II secretory pathway pseudopilin PulG